SFFAIVRRYYEFYVDLLMQMDAADPQKRYASLALQVSEQARARSLIEELAEAQAEIQQGVDPHLLDRSRSLQRQLNAKAKYQMDLIKTNHTPEQVQLLEKEIEDLL